MDNDTERLIRDNARVEHALLSPFRWLENIFKFGCFMLFCVICLGSNATWWMVGCGSMGWRDRQERSAAFVKDMDELEKSGVADYSVSFGERELPRSKDDVRPYQWGWTSDPSWMTEGFNDYYAASGVLARKLDGEARAKNLLFCSIGTGIQEPGMGLSWWFDRSRSVFGRKSSRMGEAYVTGAAAITALRVTLTEIKLGRDPLKDLSTEPGQPTSLCHVDPFDVLTTSNERAERWYKVSKSINLSDAPSIRVRYVEQSWEVPATPITPSPDFDAEAWYDGWLISGMCLKSECRTLRPGSESYYGLHTEGTDLNDVVHDDLNYFVTPYADLFYSTPPLSEHQVHAVDTLNRLATDEFWLSEAHKNGIYDDATVKAMASRAREMISKMLAPGKVPRMGEGGNSINILGYQG